MISSTGLEVKLTTVEEHQATGQCLPSPSINGVQLKKQPFLGVLLKVAMCVFHFHFLDYS